MVFLLCLSIQVILINAYFQLLKLSNYFTNVLMRDLFSVVAFFCLLFCWHTDDSVCKITFPVFNNLSKITSSREKKNMNVLFIWWKVESATHVQARGQYLFHIERGMRYILSLIYFARMDFAEHNISLKESLNMDGCSLMFTCFHILLC